jgi:D-sedoheptulose 7-phosphate isomerase
VSEVSEKLLDALVARHPDLAACRDDIAAARDSLIRAYEEGHKLLLCGNGGSAADCEHIAGELLKGFERRRPLPEESRRRLAAQGREGELLAEKLQQALPAFSLCGHPSLATAFANDVDPTLVFAQLVAALGSAGDVLLAISTSGAAANVMHAARAARALGLGTIGLSGRGGGGLAALCDVLIDVPGESTAEVQELHVPVYHHLCRAVEAHFFGD